MLRQFREDEKCECGAKETVTHFLIDCPRLATEQQAQREKIGEACGNISLMLGAKGQVITDSSAKNNILGAVFVVPPALFLPNPPWVQCDNRLI
jgi:hypothetical protein